MHVQTFRAATMAEVLARMSEALGPDAIILDTRTIHRRDWLWFGHRRVESIEVTAAPGRREWQTWRGGGGAEFVDAGE